MNLLRGIREYLLSSGRLTGKPGMPFASIQSVGAWDNLADRNDAREALRSIVGQQLYLDRLPQTAGRVAIVLRTVDVERDYGVDGDSDARRDYIELAIHSRGENSANTSQQVADLLSLCLSGYHTDFWGDHWIDECLIEGESTQSIPKGDGSDEHSFIRIMDISVLHTPATPRYPHQPLAASFSFQSQPGAGTELRLVDATIVPEGRSIANIQWVVRESDGGTVVVSVSGAPAASITGTTGVSGTYREPSFDRLEFSIYGTVYVTISVTDSAGQTSSHTSSQTVTVQPESYRLGWNMARPVYSGESQPFIDLGPLSSPYTDNITGGVVDENTGDHVSGEVKYSWQANFGDTLLPGTYDISWTGTATGPATFGVTDGVTDSVDITFNGGTLSDLSIIRQGDSGTYTSTFETRYAAGECIRFMEAHRINEPEYQSNHPWVRVVVGASNTFHHKLPTPALLRSICESFSPVKDCWISIHHLATNANVTAIAQAFIAFPGTVYIEHSNEVTFTSASQHAYALAQANASGDYSSAPGDAAKRAAWHADRTDEIGELFKAVIPSAVVVCGSQLDTPNYINNSYDYTVRGLDYIDAFAVAPYLGRPVIAGIDDGVLNGSTNAQIIDYARQDLNDRVKGKIYSWKQACSSRGVRLLGYEGGLHLTKNATVEAKLISASQSAEGGEVTQELIEYWNDTAGDLLMLFQDVSADAWGHYQYEHDGITSPRAQVMLDLG